MPVRYEKRITRDMLKAEREALFVFGDNMLQRGLGGQAREMRGEPNAIGIPTKVAPHRQPCAYFTDDDFPSWKRAAMDGFSALAEHLRNGGTVVIPADGIGTGLADLQRRSPRIWLALQLAFAKLKAIETEAPASCDSRP